MRNKIEFENRVREIAAQKKAKNAAGFKVVKRASIACASLVAACLVVVVLVRMPLYKHKMEDMQIGAEGMPNYDKNEPMAPDEDEFMDGILDSNNDSIFQNGNKLPPQTVEITFGDENYALSEKLVGSMSSWLDKVRYASYVGEYDTTGTKVYEIRYVYDDSEEIYYISDNLVKLNDGEWFEFNQKLRDEFDEIVEKCREE